VHIQERSKGYTVVWAVEGQLTALARGSPFDEPLRRAVLDRRRTIVLDLADVSLVDAGGLGLVLTTYLAAIEHRIALQLGNVPPRVRHLLEVTKLTTVLPVVASPPAGRTRHVHEGAARLDWAAVGT
jgi:anti-anti-sigma factor